MTVTKKYSYQIKWLNSFDNKKFFVLFCVSFWVPQNPESLKHNILHIIDTRRLNKYIVLKNLIYKPNIISMNGNFSWSPAHTTE